MIFAVPLVYHPLSKCHREIYKCMSCQTKLILVQGFSVGGKKSIYTTDQWGKFMSGTCGPKIVNGSHTHKRINNLDGFDLCACVHVCVCVCVCV